MCVKGWCRQREGGGPAWRRGQRESSSLKAERLQETATTLPPDCTRYTHTPDTMQLSHCLRVCGSVWQGRRLIVRGSKMKDAARKIDPEALIFYLFFQEGMVTDLVQLISSLRLFAPALSRRVSVLLSSFCHPGPRLVPLCLPVLQNPKRKGWIVILLS